MSWGLLLVAVGFLAFVMVFDVMLHRIERYTHIDRKRVTRYYLVGTLIQLLAFMVTVISSTSLAVGWMMEINVLAQLTTEQIIGFSLSIVLTAIAASFWIAQASTIIGENKEQQRALDELAREAADLAGPTEL